MLKSYFMFLTELTDCCNVGKLETDDVIRNYDELFSSHFVLDPSVLLCIYLGVNEY